MILKNKKLLVITSLLTLLPIPVGLLLWNHFPETMAIHFGITGQADGFASIPFAVFVPPLCLLVGHWICCLATALDKGNKNRNQKMQAIVLWIIPVLSNLSCCGIYALALGWEFSPIAWTMIPMGLFFAIIGNYMPKTRTNSTIGIKIYWTYTSEENWNATHRFAGKIWVIGGIIIAFCALLPYLWAVGVMFAAIAVLVVLPMVYSWRYYKKELAEGKELDRSFLPKDKKARKFSVIALVILAVFIAFVLFFGDIQYTFQEDSLLVESNMYTDYTLHYDSIESLEYREENVPGLRVGGYGSFRLLMGYFENEEFGTYTRYTYYQPDSCIVVHTTHGTLVLSGKDAKETEEIYLSLIAYTTILGDGSEH